MLGERESARPRHKCTATIAVVWIIVTGMVDDLESLTLKYWIAVQRIRRMTVPAADKAIVLADVEAICLRGRGQRNPGARAGGRHS